MFVSGAGFEKNPGIMRTLAQKLHRRGLELHRRSPKRHRRARQTVPLHPGICTTRAAGRRCILVEVAETTMMGVWTD